MNTKRYLVTTQYEILAPEEMAEEVVVQAIRGTLRTYRTNWVPGSGFLTAQIEPERLVTFERIEA